MKQYQIAIHSSDEYIAVLRRLFAHGYLVSDARYSSIEEMAKNSALCWYKFLKIGVSYSFDFSIFPDRGCKRVIYRGDYPEDFINITVDDAIEMINNGFRNA